MTWVALLYVILSLLLFCNNWYRNRGVHGRVDSWQWSQVIRFRYSNVTSATITTWKSFFRHNRKERNSQFGNYLHRFHFWSKTETDRFQYIVGNFTITLFNLTFILHNSNTETDAWILPNEIDCRVIDPECLAALKESRIITREERVNGFMQVNKKWRETMESFDQRLLIDQCANLHYSSTYLRRHCMTTLTCHPSPTSPLFSLTPYYPSYHLTTLGPLGRTQPGTAHRHAP